MVVAKNSLSLSLSLSEPCCSAVSCGRAGYVPGLVWSKGGVILGIAEKWAN